MITNIYQVMATVAFNKRQRQQTGKMVCLLNDCSYYSHRCKILSPYSESFVLLRFEWDSRSAVISVQNKIRCSVKRIEFSSPQTSSRIGVPTRLSCVTDLQTRRARQGCLSGTKVRNTAVYTKGIH